MTGHTQLSGIARATRLRLIRSNGSAPEDRHHNQPAVGELIITHYGVAGVRCFAFAAEAFEKSEGETKRARRSKKFFFAFLATFASIFCILVPLSVASALAIGYCVLVIVSQGGSYLPARQ